MNEYTPKQGDIIEFFSTKEQELNVNNSALIINNHEFYNKTGLLIVCPISNPKKQFPLHLKLNELDKNINTFGVILTQHVRTIDPAARKIKFKESTSDDLVESVKKTINLFF